MADWKVGDRALCVKHGPVVYDHPAGIPQIGGVYDVRRVGVDGRGTVGLWFEEFPGDLLSDGFAAWCFRKLEPHEFDEEDLITIDLYKRVPEFGKSVGPHHGN